MEPQNDGETIMTGREVSQYLKIPLSSLYELTKKGIIRGVKIGKHWRYLRQDIRQFLFGKRTAVPQNAATNHHVQ
ncbi:MAG TPA: helix-turn-helix domain-containing protein [bacterium]|nr:helix-turn-helix domain-containing protein [bacterium]